MADGITDVPQLDTAKFRNLDDLIFNILDGVGNKMSALAVAVAGKALDTAANVSDRAISATQSPMDSNFVAASATPEVSRGAEIEAPGRGKGIEMSSTPSMGSEPLAQSKSPVVAQVSNAELGNLTPVNFGVGQQSNSQGMAV